MSVCCATFGLDCTSQPDGTSQDGREAGHEGIPPQQRNVLAGGERLFENQASVGHYYCGAVRPMARSSLSCAWL